MYRIKKDTPAFTVNTGEFNIQVDGNTSQEDLEKVARLPEYEGLIVSDVKVTTATKENKVITSKTNENGTEKE